MNKKSRNYTLPIVFFIIALVTGMILTIQLYQVYVNVDKLEERAQISADAAEMHSNLSMLSVNMEKYGVTTGHSGLLHTPLNDMEQNYKAIQSLEERSLKISKLEHDSSAYQTGLDDMRGTLREIQLNAWKAKAYSSVWSLVCGLFLTMSIVSYFYLWWNKYN